MEKMCRWCNEIKPLTEFSPHKQMADGHLNKCKKCRASYIKDYRKTPSGIASRQKEKQYPESKKRYKKSEKGKLAQKRYVRKKDRESSRSAVRYALRVGKLVALPCFICGDKAQAHHSSYASDMKLAVTWLCQKHHNQVHIEHLDYKFWS
jgi:hypothetical protein